MAAPLALGWPIDPEKREALKKKIGHIPAVYRNSSRFRCTECKEPIWLGPRTTAAVSEVGAVPICGECAVKLGVNKDHQVINLGNPEGKLN